MWQRGNLNKAWLVDVVLSSPCEGESIHLEQLTTKTTAL